MKNSLFSIFDNYPNLVVSLSEKKDGSMKLSDNSVINETAVENRNRFLNKLEVDTNRLVAANLIHINTVRIVTKKDTGQKISDTDGLITRDKNLFLLITVADCLPIFLYDCQKEIIGLVHGGWRSLTQNILSSAIKKLTEEFDSRPEKILAGIGPGISQCHFEVKKGVLARFQSFLSMAMIRKDKKIFLDLKKIAEIQLINLGLKKENIEISSDCTYCLNNKYFSYRRDRPEILETMIAVIGMK